MAADFDAVVTAQFALSQWYDFERELLIDFQLAISSKKRGSNHGDNRGEGAIWGDAMRGWNQILSLKRNDSEASANAPAIGAEPPAGVEAEDFFFCCLFFLLLSEITKKEENIRLRSKTK